jgi:hypothetical protein
MFQPVEYSVIREGTKISLLQISKYFLKLNQLILKT